MELQQLIYFRNLADTQNMRQTAENLHVTQSTISVAIKHLEEELGVRLFDRKNRSLTINEFGRIFLQRADMALYQLDRGIEELAAARTDSSKHVSISCPPYFLQPSLIDYIYTSVPQVVLEMKRMDYYEIRNELLANTLDMSLIGPQIPSDDRLETFPVERSRMCILAAGTHRLAARKNVLFSELRDEHFSTYVRTMGPRIALENICRKNGFSPKVIFEADTITDVLQPVKSGLCIAYVPKHLFNVYNTEGLVRLELSDPDAYVDMQLCMSKNRRQRPIVEQTKNAILRFHQEDPN